MAAVDRDVERVASDPQTRRCTSLNVKGNPCGAWALRGQDICYRHSLSDEEWRALTIRGGKKKQAKAREKAQLRDSARNRQYVHGPTLARAVEEIGRLLDATMEPGSSEPDYLSRAWGLLALATLFRIRPEQRAEILELLTRVRPKVAVDPQSERLLDLKRARDELLRAYEGGAIETADLPPELLGLVASR